MMKLFGVILMSIGLTCESALAQISPEIPVRWESVEFTEPGEHIYELPKNVDMIWVYGCGGGGAGKAMPSVAISGISGTKTGLISQAGEGAIIKRQHLFIEPYNNIVVTIGAGGLASNISKSRVTTDGEDSRVTTTDYNLERTIIFPGGKSGAIENLAVFKNQSRGNSRGLGGKPGESASDNSCAGGGIIVRGGINGNGGSGFVRISWPIHLDRTQKTIERIDEQSLRDLVTADELDALKFAIKEDLLLELSKD